MRGYNTLSERGKTKLKTALAQDDPTPEIGAAWGVKEQLRRVLATTTVAAAQRERALFNQYVTWAAMPETTRLKNTIDTWWPAIATFIRIRATNAKTEAANVTHQERQMNRPRIPIPRQLPMPDHALQHGPDGRLTTPPITRKIEDPRCPGLGH